MADPRVPRDSGAPIEVCAIVEDSLFGYELAAHGVDVPILVLGCTVDAIPRVRLTAFDPAAEAGLRLATLHGRAIDAGRPRVRCRPRQDEALYAGWPTAVSHAWEVLEPALTQGGPQWDLSMAICRALENALAIASLHLAEWDPSIDFCGLVRQAEFGLPLHDTDGGTGLLTQRTGDLWTLEWHSGSRGLELEFSPLALSSGVPDVIPRDARG
ncbi:MAG: hypothetical protein ABI920_06955 [Casimicrobiaceae bacterium]